MSTEQRSTSPRESNSNELNFLLSGGLNVLANRLASPQVVLPWVYSFIGGPLFLIGLLIPSVRAGGLLAQLVIVPTLLARETRKWAYVIASFVLAATLVLIDAATLASNVGAAVGIFFVCTLMLGACNGIAVLTAQEVMAKAVKHTRIGPLLAIQASIGGLLTIVFSGLVVYFFPDSASTGHHLVLIATAAAVWVCGGVLFSMIREPPSEVQPKRSVWAETRRGWELFRTTAWFRRFFVIRALFLSVGLATPFYSIHAATEYQAGAQSLGYFVMAAGVTNIFSGPIWSRMLAESPGRVLIWSGVLAAAAGGVALLQAAVSSLPLPLLYIVVFALLELAVEGLTQSSKTYLALMAPPADRPRFLAVSNALLGVLAIGVSGIIGVIAHTIHIYLALGVLVALALVASASAVMLKPISTRLVG